MPTTALKLTADQQKALDAVNSGRNVLLTGEAGTGKSYLLSSMFIPKTFSCLPIIMTP